MRGVTERYPSRVQTAASTSTTMTESDVTLRFSHERLGHFPYRCPIWLMLHLFLLQATDKRPCSPTYSPSSNPGITCPES